MANIVKAKNRSCKICYAHSDDRSRMGVFHFYFFPLKYLANNIELFVGSNAIFVFIQSLTLF